MKHQQGSRTSMLDRLFQRQVRHIELPSGGGDLAERVATQIRREMGGLLPPFAIHLPEPEALAACWAIMREPAVGTTVPRTTKEAVAATVSQINECPYCVDVHTTNLYALAQSDVGAKVAAGRGDDVTDANLRPILAWARATRSPGSPILADPPFPHTAVPELVGTALGFHYINRMVSIFLPHSLLPNTAGGALARTLKRLIGAGIRGRLLRSHSPGAALECLPDTGRSNDDEFSWASADPIIHTAFTRAAATFDDLGAHGVPAAVRELVIEYLAQWHGEHPPMSRRWVDDASAGLADKLRPAARLALLTAVAPYQVDTGIIEDARSATDSHNATQSDRRLIAATAWASFTAVRRINQWGFAGSTA